MRKSLILMTLPIVSACSTTPPPEAALEVDTVETSFGQKVADPYRWLENDVRVYAKVRDWVTAQNKVTDAYLDTLPGRDILKRRMTELYNYERVGLPRQEGGRYFYQRNSGLQNQAPLYVRDKVALTTEERARVKAAQTLASG